MSTCFKCGEKTKHGDPLCTLCVTREWVAAQQQRKDAPEPYPSIAVALSTPESRSSKPSVHRQAVSRIRAAWERCDREARVERKRSFERCSSAFFFEVQAVLDDVEKADKHGDFRRLVPTPSDLLPRNEGTTEEICDLVIAAQSGDQHALDRATLRLIERQAELMEYVGDAAAHDSVAPDAAVGEDSDR